MNFELSDEQREIRQAARQALAGHETLAKARDALDGEQLPDLWPTAREAGWPGLLVDEHRGGAGLGAIEAMLVMAECGRVLASVPLLGHLPATAILGAAGAAGGELGELLSRVGGGEARAAFAPARPPDDLTSDWTVDPLRGHERGRAPVVSAGNGEVTLRGSIHWVPDLTGADAVVVTAVDSAGAPAAVLLEPGATGVAIEPAMRYDATRVLGHLELDGARGRLLGGIGADELQSAWFLAQGLIAAESLGGVEVALEVSLAYAKERHTFGRPIGSYQAIKHELVEVLRVLENARSLLYYAGWAYEEARDEFPLAASAARLAAGKAMDYATRAFISVHGGIGATWEHDAPFYFRRAQLSRRLLGGTGDAADRVAGELLGQAAAAPA